MRVIVYTTADDTCPAGQRFLAALFEGKTRLPITFPASSPDAASANAQAFWRREIEKEAAKLRAVEERLARWAISNRRTKNEGGQ